MHEKRLSERGAARDELRVERLQFLDEPGLTIDHQRVRHDRLQRYEQQERDRFEQRDDGSDTCDDPRDPARRAKLVLAVACPAVALREIGVERFTRLLLH